MSESFGSPEYPWGSNFWSLPPLATRRASSPQAAALMGPSPLKVPRVVPIPPQRKRKALLVPFSRSRNPLPGTAAPPPASQGSRPDHTSPPRTLMEPVRGENATFTASLSSFLAMLSTGAAKSSPPRKSG